LVATSLADQGNTTGTEKRKKEMKTETEVKEGSPPAILFTVKRLLSYWGLILALSLAAVVFIALFTYRLWVEQESDLRKAQGEHLRNVDAWPKEKHQSFPERPKEEK
jgi:uncharacterized protein HemX